MPFVSPNLPLEAVFLNGVSRMPAPTPSNAARLRAYRKKLRQYRDEHPDEYRARTRQGIRVRALWQKIWDGKARQTAAPVRHLIPVNPAFGAGA